MFSEEIKERLNAGERNRHSITTRQKLQRGIIQNGAE